MRQPFDACRSKSGTLRCCHPGAMAMLLDGLALRIDPKQVQPAVAHQVAHDFVACHHAVDGRARRFDEDAQAQRRVAQRAAVVQRLHRQPDAQIAAVALEHAQVPTDHVVQQLVAAAVAPVVHRAGVVLQVDPVL